MEGNNIGDIGVKAIAQLIRNPCQNSKGLTKINLNQCGFTNEGLEELRGALYQRANLATTHNLTHIKVTYERNNIEY